MPEQRDQMPQPILNKPNQQAYPLRVVTAVVDEARSNNIGSPLTPHPSDNGLIIFPSTPSTSNAKYSTVSFTVPDQVEKSHRGSISARPSSVQINQMSNQQQPLSPQSSQQGSQPSLSQQGSQPSLSQQQQQQQQQQQLQGPSQSRPLTASTIKTPPSTHDTGFPNYAAQVNISRQPSVSNAHQQATRNASVGSSGSACSSRQNSTTTVDFIQFSPQSFFHVGHTTSPDTAKSPSDIVSLDSKEKVQSPVDMALASAKKVKEKQTKAVIGTPTAQVPFYEFFQKQDDQKIHILIGATGSVATIKVPLIIAKLYKIFGPSKVSIQLVVTKCAEHFLKGLKISTEVKIWRDDEEWYGYKKTGDAILHQELRKWADIFLISPMSANTLAKMANGICDNLLTAIIRSWNPQYPMLIAPAMNTFMYTHPVTKKHLGFIKDECPWVEVLRPVEKVLVCGDIGMGGMREWSDIVEILVKKIKKMSDAKPYDPNSVDDDKDEEEEEDEDEDGEDGEDGEDDDDDDEDDEDDDDDDDDEDEDEDEEDVLKTGSAPAPI